MTDTITGISSMATREVLNEMARAYLRYNGTLARFESVGGVVAARRVESGEPFDVVVLASDAIDNLVAGGHVVSGSKADLVRSVVAVAVRAGMHQPDIGSEDELRRVVLAARTIGYSTGPSGIELRKLFDRWGIADTVRDRIVQAPPGVPVGKLVAWGEVELGFQQYSELMHIPGITVLGMMPSGCEIVTTFSAGICATSTQAEAARALLSYLCSPVVAEIKRRYGMEPAISYALQETHQ